MRSIELFAGCGGLALGIAQAGFKHDFLVECDKDSITTLNENKLRKVRHVNNWEIEESDTRELDFRRLGDIDLVSGGPPCQPFSIGGKHLGPRDPRNMWPEAIRIIREIRPKAFIFENVRGLLRPDFSDYLEYIKLQLSYPHLTIKSQESWVKHLARLRKHGKNTRSKQAIYRVIAHGINAADYGAPQKRHRAIIIGVSSEYGEDWNFPNPTHSQEALAWSKHISGDYWERHNIRKIRMPASSSEKYALNRAKKLNKRPRELPWLTVRDVIGDLPPPTKSEKISGHWQHPGAKAYPNHAGSNIDEPAKALKAGDHGVPGGENMLVNSRGRVRYFTVREMARLQSFPDEFIISGSWKAATRQLGNAVPTSVGESIGKEISKIISRKS